MSKKSEVAAKESGEHDLGKDNSCTSARRDDHPGKKAEKSKHEALRADQQISGFDTGTVGSESFPQKSTAASKEVAARRKKD